MVKQRILKVSGCDKLDEWDLRRVKENREADIFIYNYENHGYEGSGFAIYGDGKKFNYTGLSHCSCNGPVEFLAPITYTLSELEKIIEAHSQYDSKYSKPTLKRLIQELK